MMLTGAEYKVRDRFLAGEFIIHDKLTDKYKWTGHICEKCIQKEFVTRLINNRLAAYIKVNIDCERYKLIGPGKCMLIKLKSYGKSRG